MIDLIALAIQHALRPAVIANDKTYTYQDILDASFRVAAALLQDTDDLQEARVGYMISPGVDYVAVQWGIWRAGGIAVPLCISHPIPALQYTIADSGVTTVIADHEYLHLFKPWVSVQGIRLIGLPSTDHTIVGYRALPDILQARRAMILYTSGTTSLPKGVVTTHDHIKAQVTTLVSSWQWSSEDSILCVLPLHHVHGIINVVTCALWSGARLEFLHPFSVEQLFTILLSGRINLFMAVPTIYFKLITYWELLPVHEQRKCSEALSKFRLMVSGSAALPESIMNKWKAISGHTLLERYGMTEIGMGISNPYDGDRKTGYIGLPLPGVSVRLMDDHHTVVTDDQPGEIQIKGANVFNEYWNKPEATFTSFTADGWFKTGDIAILEHGYYKILGRDSIDIIKSGGYKISALEIEEVLREYPAIQDCSVIGIPDEEWGEVVAAVLVPYHNIMDLDLINPWIKSKLPGYKCPRLYKIVPELPRNAMGKVTKNDLKILFIKKA